MEHIFFIILKLTLLTITYKTINGLRLLYLKDCNFQHEPALNGCLFFEFLFCPPSL